ncbi:MAG: hypothetical protein WBV85_01200 [Solirubrobacteraceae bacterium]
MDKRDATKLTDHVLPRLQADTAVEYALRPMLTDAFRMLSAPERLLLVARPQEDLKLYLLDEKGLLAMGVRTSPPTISTQFLAADEIDISRSCHDAESTQAGVYWSTTWRVRNDPQRLEFVGRIGPDTIDEAEQFARAVALVAGWSVDAPPEPSDD